MGKLKAAPTDQAIFSKRNWQWLGAGGVVIIAGFIALGMGSITLAPILLVLGYCVLIPVGLLVGPPKATAADASDAQPVSDG